MASLRKKKKGFSTLLWILLCIVLVGGIVALTRVYEFEKPQITLLNETSLLGLGADISLEVSDEKSGIREVEVVLVQNKNRVTVYSRKFVRQGYMIKAGAGKLTETFPLDMESLDFKDGRANIEITVRDFSFWNWMQGNETTSSYSVILDTKPPKLWLIDSPDSIKPGSSGIVVFRSSEPIVNLGVEINGLFYPGFPIPARGGDIYGSMIGMPFDTEIVENAKIRGADRAGNIGTVHFGLNIRKKRKHSDRINISDGFLNKKIPEFSQYYPELLDIDSLVGQYLYVNNTIRQSNAATIAEICRKSGPERLWDGRFKRMRRSSRRAGFSDYRTYYYKGKDIDHQVHLGVDLASVRRADVEAANSGVVVYADYLGIYGQMVIIDHGIGVFSLYSHMSQIIVQVGDQVEKGVSIGKTGNTGMAGGDHLHFSMLVNGVFVNPLEWWDRSWLELHILNYLKG